MVAVTRQQTPLPGLSDRWPLLETPSLREIDRICDLMVCAAGHSMIGPGRTVRRARAAHEQLVDLPHECPGTGQVAEGEEAWVAIPFQPVAGDASPGQARWD